jgi:transmembrane sensor
MVSVKGASTDSVKELILKSNRKAVYSKKDKSLVESAVGDGSLQKLSTKSKLEFNEVALKDIVKVLNVAHGVNITISNERMTECIITADLRNETLDISIAILAKAINAEFTVRGKDIILSGKGCGGSQP